MVCCPGSTRDILKKGVIWRNRRRSVKESCSVKVVKRASQVRLCHCSLCVMHSVYTGGEA